MLIKSLLILALLGFQSSPAPQGNRGARGTQPNPVLEAQAAELRTIIQSTKPLPLPASDLKAIPPQAGWEHGMVSWVAADKTGLIYFLQRGDKADPVVVLDKTGKVVRSWGKGMYTMPHAIRIDPEGNVWTADAASSMIYKFSPAGQKLMEIHVGGQPSPCNNNFCSTTDIAFAKNGNIFISDGYANARILEYTKDGKKVREWGSPGDGPGQFRLPHSIAIDENDIVYVADRENGRIQKFDQSGRFLGEWPKYGKTFGLAVTPGVVWLASQHRNERNLSPGWLLKVDSKTGNLLGYVPVTGVHGMSIMPNGDLIVGPGPNSAMPQYFGKR